MGLSLTTFTKNLFLKNLENLTGGTLEIILPDSEKIFGDARGDLRATIVVHDERFFQRAVVGGDVALGESWIDGEWSSPDLVSVIRLAARNLPARERQSRTTAALRRLVDFIRHRLRGNSITGSRRNIRAHYDLSNDFFELFLDRSMMYSCAYYPTEESSLEAAQAAKLDQICRKLQLRPEDHLLEIGTGWGGFAEHAVRNYGCRITTTTISRQQHHFAKERFASFPEGARIELLQEDYRNLRGQYDKLVSIEMFEAVGLDYYDEFFAACDRLLRPGGLMCLQTITINEQTFPAYRRRPDFTQKHIFPGAELASVSEILKSLARVTSLSLFHAEDIGTHYARTLAAWRERFHAEIDKVRKLGFDDRFIRMWHYYFAYCEGAFLERHIGDFQLLLAKNHTPRVLFHEPWSEEFSSARQERKSPDAVLR